jgi:hypothetical protein
MTIVFYMSFFVEFFYMSYEYLVLAETHMDYCIAASEGDVEMLLM